MVKRIFVFEDMSLSVELTDDLLAFSVFIRRCVTANQHRDVYFLQDLRQFQYHTVNGFCILYKFPCGRNSTRSASLGFYPHFDMLVDVEIFVVGFQAVFETICLVLFIEINRHREIFACR